MNAERAAATTRRSATIGITAMVAATASWGLGTVAAKAALDETSMRPMSLQSVQLTASIVILVLANLAHGSLPARSWPAWRQGRAGILEPGASYVLYIVGLSLTAATHASIIGALEPTFVVLGSWLVFQQRISGRAALLMAMSLGGVVAVVGSGSSGQSSRGGDLLIALSVVCAASYVMASSRVVRSVQPLTLTLLQQGWALVIVLPALAVSVVSGGFGPVPDGAGWLLVVVSGLLSYLAPFALYLFALQHLEAPLAAQFLALIPLFGLVGSVVFLGEPLTVRAAIGGLVVVAALVGLARLHRPHYAGDMTTLVYTEAELMREHDYAEPQIVNGRRMHGGFLADGTYQPPRALVRERALQAWTEALRERDGELLDADATLLDGVRMPTVEQSRVLLRRGLDSWFWNSLTVTGKIEAKGRLLAEIEFPDLQPFIVEDISTMAIGHLNRGLLKAHGIDEGGDPASGVGGHDEMWFVARDLAFGEGAHADIEPPDNIARPEAGTRFMPEVSPTVEGVLSLLMNLLVIEFRAELGFASAQALLRTDDLFVDRRREAEEAAELIGRIRADEEIHVSSLRLYLGELSSITFTTLDGDTIPGRELIDRFWGGLVRWATIEQPQIFAKHQREAIEQLINTHPDAAEVLAEFDAAGLVAGRR